MGTHEHNTNANEGLQQRVEDLTSRLRAEVSKAKSTHEAAMLSLTSDCSRALQDLATLFTDRLNAMQNIHREHISQIEEEITYLKEIANSQHIMLQNNIEYIKELEERYVVKSNGSEA